MRIPRVRYGIHHRSRNASFFPARGHSGAVEDRASDPVRGEAGAEGVPCGVSEDAVLVRMWLVFGEPGPGFRQVGLRDVEDLHPQVQMHLLGDRVLRPGGRTVAGDAT